MNISMYTISRLKSPEPTLWTGGFFTSYVLHGLYLLIIIKSLIELSIRLFNCLIEKDESTKSLTVIAPTLGTLKCVCNTENAHSMNP